VRLLSDCELMIENDQSLSPRRRLVKMEGQVRDLRTPTDHSDPCIAPGQSTINFFLKPLSDLFNIETVTIEKPVVAFYKFQAACRHIAIKIRNGFSQGSCRCFIVIKTESEIIQRQNSLFSNPVLKKGTRMSNRSCLVS
jgi:hypothetical protein